MALLQRAMIKDTLYKLWYWFGTLDDNYFIQSYNRNKALSIERARQALKEAWTPKLEEKLNAHFNQKDINRFN